ncbi:MAG: hypothetical protein K6G57_02035, partial [Lachnospiraceae bacterium]|nr:hypothetical protein [Lachnospiraceae bacterium]
IPSKLVGDKERVEQIIINLVSNAIKYTNSGKVEISLTYDAKPSLLGIVVSDTGRGMRPDDLEKIFDVSGRERAVDRSTIESSGLGLGITGKLVEMMDGEISAKSKYGEGATFTAKIVQRTAEV